MRVVQICRSPLKLIPISRHPPISVELSISSELPLSGLSCCPVSCGTEAQRSKAGAMATTNVSSKATAPAGTETRLREEKPSAEETPPATAAPETTRFPKDLDGASHGPVWKSVGVPLRADPANNPSSDEWDQARQAFKETGLLKRVTSELG